LKKGWPRQLVVWVRSTRSLGKLSVSGISSCPSGTGNELPVLLWT